MKAAPALSILAALAASVVATGLAAAEVPAARAVPSSRPVEFVNDVMPILAKAGCNASACHGSPAGKGGFKLSLFGYEPALDHEAIVKEGEGHRIDLKDPPHSLILLKPTATVPHGGGPRFKVSSPFYKTLFAWLKAGAPGIDASAAHVTKVTVAPESPWLKSTGARQRLVVTAHLSDGATRDVTEQALFSSNDDAVAAVDENGLVTARRPGETAVMVRYLGQVAVSRVAVLPTWKLDRYPKLAQLNFVDGHVQAKLRKLRVVPSGLCSDSEFIRRATLDTCGIIPTPEEVRAFVADVSPDKRARLIDRLLERPEFVDLWTLKWNDILRNNPRVTRAGLLPYSNWIREQIRTNRPFDAFVRDLLTASGKNVDLKLEVGNLPRQLQNAPRVDRLVEEINAAPFNPAANYYVVTRDPLDLTSATSQVFLGVRLECARCHNHPFERWTQNDFYGLAAYFTGINARGGNQLPQVVTVGERRRELRHPTTREVVTPRLLDAVAAKPGIEDGGRLPALRATLPPSALSKKEEWAPGTDRRAEVAVWLTSAENPFFARAIANRLWAHYFGRGIVEPVDDFRVTNPPSNPELLDALAKELVAHGFDLKHLHRVILNSRTYQQSSRPNEYNRQDTRNFARYYPKRMMAEQLYDSISQTTGVFLPAPGGPRAAGGGRPPFGAGLLAGPFGQDLSSLGPITRVMQLPAVPQARRGRGGELREFLDTFGRPRREVVCECERSADGNVGQALALINGNEVNEKIAAPEGRVQRLLHDSKPDAEVVEELYLAALSRRPVGQELTEATALIRSARSREEGVTDLIWSLLNSREFLFIH